MNAPAVASDKDYGDILDIIRPRSDSPDYYLWVFLGFVALIIVLVLTEAYIIRRRHRAHQHRAFKGLAEEKGLTAPEEAIVWQIAEAASPGNPLIILSSMSAFNRGVDHLKAMIGEGDATSIRNLDEWLVLIRRKLRFDELPAGWVLKTTRDIPVGQRLFAGFKHDEQTRFCTCLVAEVDASGILVSPLLRPDEEAFRKVTGEDIVYVRLWRHGDTEYKFRTRLLPETDPDRGTLLLAHTGKMDRVQRRDYFRLGVRIPTSLYALPEGVDPATPAGEIPIEPDTPPAYKGTIVNLSAGGLLVSATLPRTEDEYLVVDPSYDEEFSLAGIVCQLVRSESRGKDRYLHHLEFANVNDTLQDRLVRQIHRTQVKQSRG